MATETTKRQCKGEKADGSPCGAHPLKGTDYCIGHSDKETQASVGFGGALNGAKGGRPRKPREIDVIRENIEARVGAIDRLLQEAEQATRPVIIGSGKTARLEHVPDWPVRLAAIRERLDRGYGRPKQTAELTVIEESQLDAAIRRMEEELAANDEVTV